MEIIRSARRASPQKVAIFSAGKPSLTYGGLLGQSGELASSLLSSGIKSGSRISLLTAPSAEYVVGQWATWRSGSIVVPLSASAPLAELDYSIQDSGSSAILVDAKFAKAGAELARRNGIKLIEVSTTLDSSAPPDPPVLPEVAAEAGASIMYTSGAVSLGTLRASNLLREVLFVVKQAPPPVPRASCALTVPSLLKPAHLSPRGDGQTRIGCVVTPLYCDLSDCTFTHASTLRRLYCFSVLNLRFCPFWRRSPTFYRCITCMVL